MALHTCSPAWEECRKQSQIAGCVSPPSPEISKLWRFLSFSSNTKLLLSNWLPSVYQLYRNLRFEKFWNEEKKNQWNGAVQIGLQTNREQGATTATSTTQGATFTLKVSVLHFRFVALFSFTAARLIVGQCSQTSVAQTSQCFPCKLHCPHPCLEWSKADFLI